MANILSLALKINADASGLKLDPVTRALEQLGKQVQATTAVFEPLTDKSAAAAEAQEDFRKQFEALAQQLQDKQIDAQEYAQTFAELGDAAKASAQTFEEGIRVTEKFRTEEEKLAAELGRINTLLEQNAISQDTASRAKQAAVEAAAKNNDDLRASLDGVDRSLSVVETRASSVARIFGSVGDSFNSVSGIAENIGNAVRSVSEAGSAVIQFGADIAKATIAFKAFRLITENYSVPQGLLGIVLNLGKFLTVVKVAEVAARQFGIDISGLAEATTKASLVFAGFKIGGLLGLDKALAPLLSTLGTALPAALARVGVPLAASSAAGAALSSTLTTLLGFSIPGFGQLAAVGFTTVKAFLASQDALNQLATSVSATNEQARSLGVTFQDLQVQLLLDTGRSRDEIAKLGLSLSALDVRQLDNLAFANERAAKASDNFQSAVGALGATIAKTFTGLLTGITDGVGRLTAGFGDLFAGINAIADPIAAVIRPFFTLIGAGVEAILGLVGAFSSAVGAVLRFVGTVGKIVLSPVIAGFNNFADTVKSLVSGALDFVSARIEFFQNQLTTLQNFLATIPLIGQAFASSQGQVAKSSQAASAAAQDAAEAATKATQALAEEEQKQAAERDKFLQGFTDQVSSAIDESAKFGQAGFDAALRYQQSIEELKQKLDDGFFNEATFKQQADLAGKAFKDELARIEADAKLEIQIEADAEKTLAGLNQQIDSAIQKAEGFGQAGFDAAVQFQDQVNKLRQQFQDGILNETALAAGVQAANAGYDQQLEKLKQVQEEQRKIIEDDQKRIEGLLGANDAAAKVEQDILAVQREQARVAEQIAAARAEGQEEAATAAAARLAQLDQLQAKLEEQQQALEQGFGQGFEQAFAAVDQNVAQLTQRALEFGDAGLEAGVRLQEGIALAQEQARDGILNQEAFNQQVAQQQRLFEKEVENLRKVANERQRVNELVDQQLELQRFNGDAGRLAASKNVLAIEAEIARVQAEIKAARENGDNAAVRQGIARIAQLDQVAEKERAVAQGRQEIEKNINEQRQRSLEEQQRQAEESLRQREGVLNEISARRQQQFEREVQRLQELNTLGPRAIQGTDIRTQQGADLVLGLELNRQDPALIEQRIQTKILQQIAENLIENTVRNINAPVSIVGAARLN